MSNNNQQDLAGAAVAGIAAASKTPFKTAFLAVLGVAAAQLLVMFGTVAVIGTALYLIFG